MKYFFLTDGWAVGRVWGIGGLWDQATRRRAPDIEKMNFCLWDQHQQERMWLYRVEDEVLMLEVKPISTTQQGQSQSNIGQVMLTRLITADQVLERLGIAVAECQTQKNL